jgi:DNA polymerase II small subunit
MKSYEIDALISNNFLIDENATKEEIDNLEEFIAFLKQREISFVDKSVIDEYKALKEEIKINNLLPKLGRQDTSTWVSRNFSKYKQLKSIITSAYSISTTTIATAKETKEDSRIIAILGGPKIREDKVICEIEDESGFANCIADNKTDIIKDAVALLEGSFSGKFFVAKTIKYPDIPVYTERPHIDGSIAFISDIHVGSKLFAKELFLGFIKWLNLEIDEYRNLAQSIKYLVILGDAVDGVGVYPEQATEIYTTNVRAQYEELASLLDKIRKDIKIILIPGNHDASYGALPQPPVSKEFAAPLYNVRNLFLASNPSFLKIKEKVNIALYHGNSLHFYVDTIEKYGKMTRENIASIMKLLLQARHFAPSEGSTPILPMIEDPLVMVEPPQIFSIGDTHKALATKYKGTVLINSGCWQYQTNYMKKLGVEPDIAKVPIVNLNDLTFTILDFEKEKIQEFSDGINVTIK